LADEPLKLEDLAGELNVSIEYIRLIQMRAFEKVKKATKKRVAEAIVHVRLRSKDLSRGNQGEQRRLSTFDAKQRRSDAAFRSFMRGTEVDQCPIASHQPKLS
jgi:hypothetical protein